MILLSISQSVKMHKRKQEISDIFKSKKIREISHRLKRKIEISRSFEYQYYMQTTSGNTFKTAVKHTKSKKRNR
jgi:two-component sensor histidine kinase